MKQHASNDRRGAWQDMAGHGRTWQDMAGHGRTWQDMAGRGSACSAVPFPPYGESATPTPGLGPNSLEIRQLVEHYIPDVALSSGELWEACGESAVC